MGRKAQAAYWADGQTNFMPHQLTKSTLSRILMFHLLAFSCVSHATVSKMSPVPAPVNPPPLQVRLMTVFAAAVMTDTAGGFSMRGILNNHVDNIPPRQIRAAEQAALVLSYGLTHPEACASIERIGTPEALDIARQIRSIAIEHTGITAFEPLITHMSVFGDGDTFDGRKFEAFAKRVFDGSAPNVAEGVIAPAARGPGDSGNYMDEKLALRDGHEYDRSVFVANHAATLYTRAMNAFASDDAVRIRHALIELNEIHMNAPAVLNAGHRELFPALTNIAIAFRNDPQYYELAINLLANIINGNFHDGPREISAAGLKELDRLTSILSMPGPDYSQDAGKYAANIYIYPAFNRGK